jgi:hypothetical protein
LQSIKIRIENSRALQETIFNAAVVFGAGMMLGLQAILPVN